MRTVFELMEKAHETYSSARSHSSECERTRLLAEADSYLRQAEALRRDELRVIDNPNLVLAAPISRNRSAWAVRSQAEVSSPPL